MKSPGIQIKLTNANLKLLMLNQTTAGGHIIVGGWIR